MNSDNSANSATNGHSLQDRKQEKRWSSCSSSALNFYSFHIPLFVIPPPFFLRHSGAGRNPGEITDKEPPYEGTSQPSSLSTFMALYIYVCFLLYERSSWFPAFAGMTEEALETLFYPFLLFDSIFGSWRFSVSKSSIALLGAYPMASLLK